MILLIDNYDSFSYNLYQLVGEINPDIRVIRNDEMTVEEIKALAPERIILSPDREAGRCGNHSGSGEDTWKGNPHIGRLPGASGHLRSLWRGCDLCEGADARQAVKNYVCQGMSPVSRMPGGDGSGQIPFAGGG